MKDKIKELFERNIECMVNVNFLYTNESGETTTLTKDYIDLLGKSEFEFLVDEFKMFLHASGFANKTIDKLQIVED
jgi:hypothetical protein